MTPRPWVESFRTRLRQAQLAAGLGFAALVLGSLVALWLERALAPALAAWSSQGAARVLALALSRLWVLLALPLLTYVIATVVALRPLFTAVGAALCGELFLLGLHTASGGSLSGSAALAHLLSLGLGIFLTQQGARVALRRAEAREASSVSEAAAQKAAYDTFAAAEAARLAKRERGD